MFRGPKPNVWNSTRETLDKLGYRELLTHESLPLVQHLLSDLTNHKKELFQTKDELEKVRKESTDALACIEPYQKENGKLLSENNQLRMQDIKLRENVDQLNRERENGVNSLQSENQNLKFLVGELKKKIFDLEELDRRKSDKIVTLQAKNLKAVILTPGGTKKPIAHQRQRMQLTSTLQLSSMSGNKICHKCGCEVGGCRMTHKGFTHNDKANDVYLADLLKMTDKKLLDLQQQIQSQKQTALRSQEECGLLKQHIETREKEINRLQHVLEGGRPVSAVLEDNRLHAAHAHMHQLELHIDMLTKTNMVLESKLKGVVGDTHEAMNRAIDLADENSHLAKELHVAEKDCNDTAEVLNVALTETREKLHACEKELAEQHRVYHILKDERDQLHADLVKVRHDHSRLCHDHSMMVTERGSLIEDNKRMDDLLRRGQEDRKHMTDRINHLTVKIQDLETDKIRLTGQCESLRATLSELQGEKKSVETSKEYFKSESERLDNQKKDLETEKNYYKNESAKLQELKTTLEQERNYYKDQTAMLEEQKRTTEQARDYFSDDVAKLQSQLQEADTLKIAVQQQCGQLQSEKSDIEREKDHYSAQVIQLLDLLKSRSTSTPNTPMQIGKRQKPVSVEEELAKTAYERDVLKQERDFYKIQYQSMKSQLEGSASSRRSVSRQGSSSGPTVPQPSGIHGYVPSKPPGSAQAAPTMPPIPQPQMSNIAMETVAKERDFYKQQMDHFQQLYTDAKSQIKPSTTPSSGFHFQGSTRPSSGQMSPTTGTRSGWHTPDALSRASDSSQQQVQVEAELNGVKSELRVYQQERDFFKQQYEALKASISQPRQGEETLDPENLLRERDMIAEEKEFYRNQYNDMTRKLASASASAPSRPHISRQELDVLLSEKRQVIMSNAELEAQIRNLKSEVQEAQDEKKNFDMLNKELNRSFQQIQEAAINKFPPSTQDFVMEIRKSRDSAMAELERVKKERDEVRGKLKLVTMQQARDKSAAEQESANFKLQFDEGDRATSELHMRLQNQATLISSLQEQVQALQEALQQANNELGMQSKQSSKFRKTLEAKLGELGDQDEQLEIRINQLTSAEQKIVLLSAEVADLKAEVDRLQNIENNLRTNVAKLDHDKDMLNSELDTKTEIIASLREELRLKLSQISQLEADLTKLNGQLEASHAATGAEQTKLAAEELRYQRIQQELAATIHARDGANREIRRLQKELASLAQDYKNLQGEMEKLKLSKDNFKRKAQEYCRTLEQLTGIVNLKEDEQSDLRKQYLSLNETVSSLKSLNASLEESVNHREERINKVEEMLDKFKEEREDLVNQLMEASQKLDDMETTCHKLEEEKFAVEKELLNTREIAQKLDSRKLDAENEIKRLTATLEKLLEHKRTIEQQMDSTSNQLSEERSTLRSLEEVLNEKRRYEWTSEANLKQLEIEKAQLQRKVSELQDQLEEEVAEVKRLRARAAQSENDIERLRRELTAEQFERERATQELRRVQKFSRMNFVLDNVDNTEMLDNLRLSPTPPHNSFSPNGTASYSKTSLEKDQSKKDSQYKSEDKINLSYTSRNGIMGSEVNELSQSLRSFNDQESTKLSFPNDIDTSYNISYKYNKSKSSSPPLSSSSTLTESIQSSKRNVQQTRSSNSIESKTVSTFSSSLASVGQIKEKSSSSDTGLERSVQNNQSSSNESLREPWKLAFGSNRHLNFDLNLNNYSSETNNLNEQSVRPKTNSKSRHRQSSDSDH